MSSHVTSNLAYSFCYAKRFLWLSLETLKPSSRCQPKNKPYYAPQSSTRKKKPILIDYTHQLIHHQNAPFHAWKSTMKMHDLICLYLSLSHPGMMARYKPLCPHVILSHKFFSLTQICQQFLAAMIRWKINIDDGTLIVIFTFLFVYIATKLFHIWMNRFSRLQGGTKT